jgi:hypothetical protein
MGEPKPGGERRVLFGESHGSHGNPARIDEALDGLAQQIVGESRDVTQDTGPKWYRITLLEIEIENQNVKTFVVGATPKG